MGGQGGTGYNGGHLFGNGFGGGGEYANLVAMLRDVNRGRGTDTYLHLESQWRKMLSDDPSTRMEVSIRPTYGPSGSAPIRVRVKYQINDAKPETDVFKNG